MFKFINFCMAAMAIAFAGHAQQPFSGSPGTDTTTFNYVSEQILKQKLLYSDSAGKARVHKLHGRWDNFWRIRASKDAASANLFTPYMRAIGHAMRQPPFCPNYNYRGNWSYFGPGYNNFNKAKDNNGRMVSVWVSPTDPQYILAGAPAGGLWKTTNGGQTWANITDQLNDPKIPGTMGITSIAVHPDNQNIIYLSTGAFKGGGDYGLGLIYSDDGGTSWHIDQNYRTVAGTNGNWGYENDAHPLKIAYSPYSKKLYAVAGKKILMKPPNSAFWQNITPAVFAGSSYIFADFEFSSATAGRVFFCTSSGSTVQYLLRLGESSGQWDIRNLAFPSPAYYTLGAVYDIALSTQDDVYWSLEHFRPDYPSIGQLYHCSSDGSNLVLRNGYLTTNARWLAASRTHPGLLYLTNGSGGNPSIHKSTDGGTSWGSGICNTHPDGQAILLYKDGDRADGWNDVLYAATDGGMAMKSAGAFSFHSISGAGLNVMQFHGMSNNPVNNGMLIGGSHDNGIHAYYRESPTPWINRVWGDGMITTFGKNGLNTAYTQSNGGTTVVTGNFNYIPATANQPAHVTTSTGPGNTPDWGFRIFRWRIPMKVDAQNTLRIGKHFIYRRIGNAWLSSFGSSQANMMEPKPLITTNTADEANVKLVAANKRPIDFIIAEREPTTAYIAYENRLSNAGDFNVINYGNLFRSKNVGLGSQQSWEKINPADINNILTDIEMDPAHPNRIWACYGGVVPWEIADAAENRKHRVYYSDNYGDSWTDMSKGLPMVPVTKILYVEGTDDLLFAGTDLGVYRWNKGQGIWQCFGEGMPKCIVSEMEVNYCSGKLRVSTFGRGIWESDISADMGSYTPGYAHTINANTTWSSSKTVNGSILVKAGATFTISGTPSSTGNSTIIYMPYKGKITVERGARLIIDGATLTNDCGAATPWYGIEVAGNNRRPATAQYQGVLELRNGALLQHARVAISNFDLPGYKCGGLIYASNSSINNCIKAVALNNTRTSFYNSGGTVTCSFNNVNFKKDDPAYPIDRLGYFSSWSMEKGVELIDCRFDYTVPASALPYGQRYWAAHIQSTGAKIEKCSFKGFDRGIYATDYDGSGRPLDIRKSDFTKNTTGIMVAGNTYGTIGANTISQMAMPPIIYFSPKAVGIYLDRTQGAHVSGNSITSENKAVQTIGVLANNTQWYGTTVTHNSLFNLNRGFQSQGFNDAVTLKCNTFKDDKYGMAINPQWFQGGMGSFNNQGTGCNSYRSQADNTFSGNTKDIASYQVPAWKYYAGDQMGEMPSTWSGSVQVVPHCGGSTFKSSICSMLREGYLGLGGRRRGQLIEEYRNSKKTDETGRFLYGAVVNRHYEEDALPELIAFLAEENDPISQRLLLPLYMGQGDFGMAEETLAMMDIGEEEREAYLNYYRLLDDFTNNDRSPASITEDESQMLWDIIENGREPARFAMALLEQAQQYEWEHPVDDMPADMKTARGKSPMGAAVAESVLYDAQPNPARDNVTIKCHVADDDSYKEPVLLIRNIEGSVVYKRTLGKGVNAVPVATGKWPSGIYLYSLEVAGKERDTRKLSVVR